MPGPAPKHPSIRARRNNPKAGFTALPQGGRTGSTPTWPLPVDASAVYAREHLQDRMSALAAEIDNTDDAQKRGGLRKQLVKAEQSEAILSLQIDQQGDLEFDMWRMLWSTPQAKLWEDSEAFVRSLAQFVRWNVKGEQGNLDAAKEARIRGKEFGLTPLTLMGLKAEIERAEQAEDRGNRRRSTVAAPTVNSDPEDGDPRGGLYAV